MPIIKCPSVPLRSWGRLFSLGNGLNKVVPLGSLLSHVGNIKVPRDTAIFNFSSAHDCISAKKGLCKAKAQGCKCYALKAEVFYPYALPYRRRQEKLWKNITAEEFAAQFILINALKQKPFTALRFSESGDFHTQNDVYKAERIAQILRKHGIRCYCYTSRNDLSFEKCHHLVISGSNFLKKGISNRFRIVQDIKKERQKGESVCKMNCKICNFCKMRNMKIIIKNH